MHLALFARTVDLAIARYRRRRETGKSRSKSLRVVQLAALGVVAFKNAVVGAAVKAASVHQRRLNVSAVAAIAPGDELVARLAIAQGDIAGRLGPNGPHRRLVAVAVGYIDEPVRAERRRNGIV